MQGKLAAVKDLMSKEAVRADELRRHTGLRRIQTCVVWVLEGRMRARLSVWRCCVCSQDAGSSHSYGESAD